MTTTGRIDANDSDIQSISFEQLADPLTTQADRWQLGFTEDGANILAPGDDDADKVRLLTETDLADLEAHDADLTIIAALAVADGKFIVGRDPGSGAAWTADTIQASDIPDISATYVPNADIGTTVQAHDADLDALAALSTTGIPKRTGAGTWALIAPEFYILGAGAWQSATSGAAPSAKWETSTNKQDFWTLDFDQSSIEYAQATIKMPADWNAGTVTFDVDWTAASGSGDCIWTLEARGYSDGDDLDAAWGTGVSVTDTLIGANKFHRSATSSALTVGGTPAAGQLVQFRISRKASDGSDTLNADARLLGVTVHFSIA